MTEHQPKHECGICRHYDPFYTREYTQYKKLKKGYCRKNKQPTDCHGSCEFWQSYCHWQYKIKLSATRTLRDLLLQLSALRQILQEEQNEARK